MDRFRGPTAADEMADCEKCGDRRHYTDLEDGLCADCRFEKELILPENNNQPTT